MAASISEPLPFAPTRRTLAFALDELEELGPQGGGAVEPRARRAALEAYANFGPEQRAFPQRWRYDYASLSFDDLYWLTGRAAVPAPVARQPARPRGGAPEPFMPERGARGLEATPIVADEPAALAVENAGGLVHLGAVYLEESRRPKSPSPNSLDPLAREGLRDPRVTLLALADARRAFPDRVGSIHQRIIPAHADRFSALATAFQNCGAYVEVPDGMTLAAPLQLVWTARPGEASTVFPHTVVRIGAGARVAIVERHIGATEAFVCGLVEIELGAGAKLDYVIVQQADESSRVIFRRAARLGPGAHIAFGVAELGGGLVRSAFDVRLEGARGGADVNALFFAHGFAHADLTVDIDHAASETSSRTVVRSAASGRGQGRFTGGIRIPRATHACRASMRDDALVLSRDAYLEAVPALEIAANDVSVSHAATVGSLDEEQLFYVQSRGFARGTAERMIALAFFEPAILGLPSDVLRDEVRTALDERLDDIGATFVS
jgi:FeS assembly protein SufD